ncbi:hypothetical protein [Streptomyces sp. NPDC002573]|uniref:hypothetical protein n=1 Tax=Streptomyces sp. NPDC002573 TaxID=3364651 RepID=UPI0036939C3B
MGERLSGDGVPGRRPAHPGGAVSGPWDARGDSVLETVLAAVVREGELDPEAEQRAVAAFRAARGAGAHRARTRRRDDWRPRAERSAGRPVKTTFGVVIASLALGGVAVAVVGTAGPSRDRAETGRETGRPSAVAPARPGGATLPSPSGALGPRNRPATAKDTEAHCRAYEHVKDRGKALDATAWQRLVAAAGGTDKVAAYCSEQLARTATAPGRTGRPTEAATNAGRPGTGRHGAADAAGNGRASGSKGSGKHK